MDNKRSAHQEDRANITHAIQATSFDEALNELIERIKQRGDLPSISVQEQLMILEELAGFPLGRFLIENRGLNGRWTDYILKHPQQGKKHGLNSEGKPFKPLESFLLNCAPTFLATQERFQIFKDELQKECRNGIVMASVPCGLMSDLLDLDYTGIRDFALIGSDIDPVSIQHASKRASQLVLEDHVSFVLQNAWKLDLDQQVDVLTSNGLNIYELDDNCVTALYQCFFNTLKPGGKLITSFLTPPPIAVGTSSEWNLNCINRDHIQRQKIILLDILGVKWQSYRSSHATLSQLHAVGFKNVRFIYDRAHMFPTVIAEKHMT